MQFVPTQHPMPVRRVTSAAHFAAGDISDDDDDDASGGGGSGAIGVPDCSAHYFARREMALAADSVGSGYQASDKQVWTAAITTSPATPSRLLSQPYSLSRHTAEPPVVGDVRRERNREAAARYRERQRLRELEIRAEIEQNEKIVANLRASLCRLEETLQVPPAERVANWQPPQQVGGALDSLNALIASSPSVSLGAKHSTTSHSGSGGPMRSRRERNNESVRRSRERRRLESLVLEERASMLKRVVEVLSRCHSQLSGHPVCFASPAPSSGSMLPTAAAAADVAAAANAPTAAQREFEPDDGNNRGSIGTLTEYSNDGDDVIATTSDSANADAHDIDNNNDNDNDNDDQVVVVVEKTADVGSAAVEVGERAPDATTQCGAEIIIVANDTLNPNHNSGMDTTLDDDSCKQENDNNDNNNDDDDDEDGKSMYSSNSSCDNGGSGSQPSDSYRSKRQRNNDASRRCRQRKKQAMDELAHYNARLVAENTTLAKENALLRQLLSERTPVSV